jgi:hypothetical protein
MDNWHLQCDKYQSEMKATRTGKVCVWHFFPTLAITMMDLPQCSMPFKRNLAFQNATPT